MARYTIRQRRGNGCLASLTLAMAFLILLGLVATVAPQAAVWLCVVVLALVFLSKVIR
jgi:hypothetical protein